MKVTNIRRDEASELTPFDALMTEIYCMHASVFTEGKKSPEEQAAMKKAAKAKDKAKSVSNKKADEKRGDLDTVKAEKETKKKSTDTGEFKNSESFSNTPEDAHLHTDGKCDDSSLRHNKSARDYAEVGDLKKNPCDKHYPKFGGKKEKARIAGSLRQAYARHDDKAIKELTAAAHSAGMNPTGASWDERPECKQFQKTHDPKNLPKGWTAKQCEPHGQGGGDEWLKGHHSDATKTSRRKHGETDHQGAVNRLKTMRSGMKSGGLEALSKMGPRKSMGHDTHSAQEKHKDVKHEPSARAKHHAGSGKVYHSGYKMHGRVIPAHKKAGQLIMPKDTSASEKAKIMGNWNKDASKPGEGGKGGDLSRGARRTLSKSTQVAREAPKKNEGTKVVKAGADWHNLSKDQTGKSTSPKLKLQRAEFKSKSSSSPQKAANRLGMMRGNAERKIQRADLKTKRSAAKLKSMKGPKIAAETTRRKLKQIKGYNAYKERRQALKSTKVGK